MKKEYKTPILEIAKYEPESPMLTPSDNNNDWGQSKKGFFDEDEDIDDIENKNLWDE